MKIYIDGQYYSKADAKISVYDHGLLYGDGVFEGIRIYHGRVFQLPEHLARLYRSAQALCLEIPLTLTEMEKAVNETVAINKKKNGYIRLVVTRGPGNLGMNPTSCKKAGIIIIVDEIQLYPPEYYQKGISAITASTRRMPLDSLDPRIKSLNYLNNILAKIEAQRANCFEAIMLNHSGYIAECTGDNLFMVKSRILCTPEGTCGALDGITKNTVLKLAKKSSIHTQTGNYTQYDLYTADEVFLTGTGAEIIPVTEIDSRKIGSGNPGPVCKQLQQAFHDMILEF